MQKQVINKEKDIHTHVVLVTAFVQRGDKFLIARRSFSDPQAGGQWSTPGGKVDMEVGEDVILSTLKREIMEEVGVDIYSDIKLIKTDAFIRVSGHHVVGLHFLCRYKSGEPRPLEDQEEVGWFTLEDIMYGDFPDYLKKRANAINLFL